MGDFSVPTKDQMILINRVRAYERAIAAREKALETAESKTPASDLVLNKRYLIELVFAAGDLQPQTKVVTIDRDVDWFVCRELTFSLTEVGSVGEVSPLSVSWTMNARFRPGERSGSILIRDSYRDRAWSNRPLPDGFFSNGSFGPRALPRAAKLPGGTALSITYYPLSETASINPLLTTPSSFSFQFSFIGVEVRGGARDMLARGAA